MGHDERGVREAAVSAHARLRSGHHEAGDLAPVAPAATPPSKRTRSVLVREVLVRDEAGRIQKTKEYEVTEPLPEPGPPAIQ